MIQLKEDSMKKDQPIVECTYRIRLLPAAAFLFAAHMVHAQSILGSNLIVNPGAESGAAGTATVAATSFPGWTVTGKANVLPYGLTGLVLLTDPTPAPPPYGPGPGFQYFSCLSGACSFTQTISVSSATSMISGGNVKFTASAYLGARAGATDAQMTMAF
jgi:hypothetical protein